MLLLFIILFFVLKSKSINKKIKIMKKLLFILVAAASLTACKKNSVDAPVTPGNTNNQIKTWASGANISTYTYDAQGRISKVTISDGSGYEYEYLPGIVN